MGKDKNETNNTLNIILTNVPGATAVVTTGVAPATAWPFSISPCVKDNLDLEYWINEKANVVLVKARSATNDPNAPYHTIFACNLYVLKDATGTKILDKITGDLSKFTFGGLGAKNRFRNISIAKWEPILPAGAIPMVATGNTNANSTPVIGVDAAGAMAIYGVSADGLSIQVMDQRIAASATPTACWSNIAQTGLLSNATNKIAMIAANATKGLFAVLANGDIYKATVAAPSTTFSKLTTTKGVLKNFAAGQYSGADCLFMIDSSDNLWHQFGTGAIAQDSPAGAGVKMADISMANDGTVAALDEDGNVYRGTMATGPAITWSALPKTLSIGSLSIPLKFESVCAVSATNFIAVTQEQQVALWNGTAWAFMTLPDQSPVAGFNNVLADSNKNHIFIDADGNVYWCTDAMTRAATAQAQPPPTTFSPASAYRTYEAAENRLENAQAALRKARKAVSKNKKDPNLQNTLKAAQAAAAAARSAFLSAQRELLTITKANSLSDAISIGKNAIARSKQAIAQQKTISSEQKKAIVATNAGKTPGKAKPKTNRKLKRGGSHAARAGNQPKPTRDTKK
jgi:hypothetical protein